MAAASLALSAFSAGSQIGGGIAEHRQAKADADTLEEIGRVKARQQAKKTRRLMGRQRVAYAKSGAAMEGTPLDALAYAAFEGKLGELWIEFEHEMAAEQLERRGEAARLAGYFEGGKTLLSGLGDYYMSRSGGGGSSGSGLSAGKPTVGAPLSSSYFSRVA